MPRPAFLNLPLLVVIVSAVICCILLFAFLRLLTGSNTAMMQSKGEIITRNGLIVDRDFIDWGKLYPDSAASEVIHVKNDHSFRQELSLNAVNWEPENASQFLSLSWNYSGAVLNPKESIPLELRLSVSPDIEGIHNSGIYNFSFTIIITGVKAT